MPEHIIVNTISDLLIHLDLAPESHISNIVYRGEPEKYNLPCEPKAFRDGSSYRLSNPLHLVDPIAMSVSGWVRDVMLAEGKPLAINSELEQMILAQHYGVATRLLDWTINPLVAVWFAVTYQKDKAGYVYTVEPTEDYMDHTRESFSHVDEDSDRRNALEKNPYNHEGTRGPNPTVHKKYLNMHYFKPSYLPDARILAQSGVISIHPKPDAFDKNTLTKIIEIPAANKHYIKRQLNTLGINYRTMGLATRDNLAEKANGSDIIF